MGDSEIHTIGLLVHLPWCSVGELMLKLIIELPKQARLLGHCDMANLRMAMLQSQLNAGCRLHVCCLYSCTTLSVGPPAKTSQLLQHLPSLVH